MKTKRNLVLLSLMLLLASASSVEGQTKKKPAAKKTETDKYLNDGGVLDHLWGGLALGVSSFSRGGYGNAFELSLHGRVGYNLNNSFSAGLHLEYGQQMTKNMDVPTGVIIYGSDNAFKNILAVGAFGRQKLMGSLTGVVEIGAENYNYKFVNGATESLNRVAGYVGIGYFFEQKGGVSLDTQLLFNVIGGDGGKTYDYRIGVAFEF